MPVSTGLFFISKNTQNGERKMKDNEYVIADNVRFYRKKANLTQAELAERAELSLDSIKRVEAGKRTMALENFLRLSNALGIPLTFLLYGQKDRMPDEERIRGILEGRSNISYTCCRKWRMAWIVLWWHISAANSGFVHSENTSFSSMIITGLRKPQKITVK